MHKIAKLQQLHGQELLQHSLSGDTLFSLLKLSVPLLECSSCNISPTSNYAAMVRGEIHEAHSQLGLCKEVPEHEGAM